MLCPRRPEEGVRTPLPTRVTDSYEPPGLGVEVVWVETSLQPPKSFCF